MLIFDHKFDVLLVGSYLGDVVQLFQHDEPHIPV